MIKQVEQRFTGTGRQSRAEETVQEPARDVSNEQQTTGGKPQVMHHTFDHMNQASQSVYYDAQRPQNVSPVSRYRAQHEMTTAARR